ncbi:helix-turn-helix domain-containing protein [Paenibacillus thiaminolyticus]|uniref:helix-turn-helix transcriptional regulator n=1 Tax=Paenibacillus thiaminolyticus TaxID=49283 RepID=UPI002175B3D1|nr:helix-turn-helix domain-containing protein [Paenibacillus thiaminolyticus]
MSDRAGSRSAPEPAGQASGPRSGQLKEERRLSFIHHSSMFDFQYHNTAPYETPYFHSHANYEIYLFHSGHVHYLIGDQIYLLQPGDLILMHGLTLHRPNIDTRYPYIRSIIHFDPRYVEAIHAAGDTAQELLRPFRDLKYARLRLSEGQLEEAMQLLDRISLMEGRGDFVGVQRQRLAFLELLYCIYDWCQEPLAERSAEGEPEIRVQEAIQVIEGCYQEEITLEEIASRLHMNKHYLSKVFKEVTGTTVFTYLYHRRINQAKIWFLTEPDWSVTEVAMRAGFKHLSHFSRLFKQMVGCSPDQYRKQLQASESG